MDIATLSVLKSQAQVKQDAGIAIMKKVMNVAEENSNMMVQMLGKTSGNSPDPANLPHMGNNVDTYA